MTKMVNSTGDTKKYPRSSELVSLSLIYSEIWEISTVVLFAINNWQLCLREDRRNIFMANFLSASVDMSLTSGQNELLSPQL